MSISSTFDSAVTRLLADDEYVLQLETGSIHVTDLRVLRELVPINPPGCKQAEWSVWLLRDGDEPKLTGWSKAGTPHEYRGLR